MKDNVGIMTSLGRDPFDVRDFYRRWKEARLSGFSSEAILKAQFLDDTVKEGILKKVFDKSRKLGLSLATHFKKRLSLEQIVDLFSRASDSPCLGGQWSRLEKGKRLMRRGCGNIATPFYTVSRFFSIHPYPKALTLQSTARSPVSRL